MTEKIFKTSRCSLFTGFTVSNLHDCTFNKRNQNDVNNIDLKSKTSIFKKLKASPNDSPLKIFISSKKLFSFSRCLSFLFLSSPLFLPVSHCFRGWSKKNLKVYDVINCQNKNLITHFVWYLEKEIRCDIETLSIDRVLNKEHFYRKIMQKMCTKS